MAAQPVTYIDREDLTFVEIVGEGSFSTVWKVEWNRKERIVSPEDDSVRSIRKPIVAAAKILNRIDTPELQFLAKLSHPNVVKLLAVVDKVPDFHLILEHCERGSLESYLEKHVDEELHSCLVYSWCEQGALAIEYLHGIPIIHRDIKSGNFLISYNMNMKLCDFGLSKDAGCTITTKIKGTWGWTAPEIFLESHLSPCSDIFAFATVIWEMLTRRIPFEKVRFQDVKQKVCSGERLPIPQGCPEEIAALIIQCWDGNRRKRPDIISVLEVIRKVKVRSFELCNIDHGIEKDVPFTNLCVNIQYDDSHYHQIDLDVCNHARISTIKSRLLGSDGSLNHEYQLYYEHESLDDDKTLIDCDIDSDGKNITLKPIVNHVALNTNADTRLTNAIQSGNVVEVVICLNQGVNINEKLVIGNKPLQLAAKNGHHLVCDVLIKAGAHIHLRGLGGYTPLHIAAKNGHYQVCDVLIKAGADIHHTNRGGNMPLHIAAGNGHYQVCDVLIKAGADIHHRNLGGHMPLHIAAKNGHYQVCDVLIKAGADIHHTNIGGNMPLHIAAKNGHYQVCDVLIKAGANIHHRNWVGDTPLHDAAGYMDINKCVVC